MNFLLEGCLLFLDQEKVFFRVLADATRVDVLVIRESALVLARSTAEPADETRLRVGAFVGSVGRERLVFRSANIALRKIKYNAYQS